MFTYCWIESTNRLWIVSSRRRNRVRQKHEGKKWNCYEQHFRLSLINVMIAFIYIGNWQISWGYLWYNITNWRSYWKNSQNCTKVSHTNTLYDINAIMYWMLLLCYLHLFGGLIVLFLTFMIVTKFSGHGSWSVNIIFER